MTNQADLEQLLRGITPDSVQVRVNTFKTPLDSFDGRPYKLTSANDGYEGKMQIHLHFKDLANVKANPPYIDQMGQPKTEFDWAFNSVEPRDGKIADNTQAGMWLLSLVQFPAIPQNFPDLCAAAPLLHMERAVKSNGVNRQTGEEINPTVGYKVTAVVEGGKGGSNGSAPALDLTGSTVALALGYLDGTDGGAGFSQPALADEVIKADKQLEKAIFAGGPDGKKPNGFVGIMTAMGRVELTDGIYHVVEV